MSTWSNWICPVCKKTWYGGIGYFMTPSTTREELATLLEHICGCTGKKITEEEQKKAMIITIPHHVK